MALVVLNKSVIGFADLRLILVYVVTVIITMDVVMLVTTVFKVHKVIW